MKNTDKIIKYVAGASGLALMANTAGAVLVIKDMDVSQPAGINDYFGISSFSNGASDFTLSDENFGPNNYNIRAYGGSWGVYFEGSVFNGSGVELQFLYVGGTGPRPAANFSVGDTVEGADGTATGDYISVASSSKTFRNGFSDDESSYLGFSLTNAGQTYYGWLNFTSHSADNSMTYHRLAIETAASTGALVTAAAVPEPATTAVLLAGGALGFAALRRRRNSQRPTAA